jgi:hypothetical protein
VLTTYSNRRVALLPFIVLFFLIGCSTTRSSDPEEGTACVGPENPYDEGSGHYAG